LKNSRSDFERIRLNLILLPRRHHVRVMDVVRRAALASLIRPPRIALSKWIEANIRLPEGVSALPGAVRQPLYQRDIADAISDPAVERVTLTRLGMGSLRGRRPFGEPSKQSKRTDCHRTAG
jgi:hypothetical protein